MQQLQNRSGRQIQKALVVEVAPETARSTIPDSHNMIVITLRIMHHRFLHARNWQICAKFIAITKIFINHLALIATEPRRMLRELTECNHTGRAKPCWLQHLQLHILAILSMPLLPEFLVASLATYRALCHSRHIAPSTKFGGRLSTNQAGILYWLKHFQLHVNAIATCFHNCAWKTSQCNHRILLWTKQVYTQLHGL